MVWLPLSAAQRTLYLRVLDAYRSLPTFEFPLAVITLLKKVCDTPALLDTTQALWHSLQLDDQARTSAEVQRVIDAVHAATRALKGATAGPMVPAPDGVYDLVSGRSENPVVHSPTAPRLRRRQAVKRKVGVRV